MATRITNAAQDAANDATVGLLDAGGAGTIEIRTGSQPADADDAATGTLLGTLTFNSPAFAASSGGTAAANSIEQDSSADATGEAGWFRAKSGAGTTIFDGNITASGGGGELELNTTSIVTGGPIQITSMTFSFPASS